MVQTTAGQLAQEHFGKHVTLVEPESVVSGTLMGAFNIEGNDDYTHLEMVVFGIGMKLFVPSEVEAEVEV